jgi:hypothetical protein
MSATAITPRPYDPMTDSTEAATKPAVKTAQDLLDLFDAHWLPR